MSKLEQFIVVFLGFFIFEIIFIRFGFFAGITVSKYTLLLSFLMYLVILISTYSSSIFKLHHKIKRFIPVASFVVVSLALFVAAILLGRTYDTSWDGQGYHQTAVVALANDWNPVKDASIDFDQRLPSQIFAEGYPSALWEIESTIYAVTDRINSAKVMNFIVAIIAGLVVYSLLRKLNFGYTASPLISFFVVAQPVFIIQMLTFMEDGFGYELLLIAITSLIIIALSSKSYWAIFVFIAAQLLLLTTKYSHLPIALTLGILFIPIILNRFLNREYLFNKTTKLFILGILIVSGIFAYLPYARNYIFHHAMFYPTNITELMGSVKYNNVPQNLKDENKFSLLYFGIFSRSQTKESGDPRSDGNVAELKMPFTFSIEELNGSAGLYNNRVGGGGPLFSGIVLLSVIFFIIAYFKTKTIKERYAVYTSIFCFAFVLLLALVAPTPNLMRYVNQLQLIPFVIIIPICAVFKNLYIKVFSFIVLAIVAINMVLFSSAVLNKTIKEHNDLNNEYSQMRNSGKTYQVRTQQFYSSLVVLKEQGIPFEAVTSLKCKEVKSFITSSTTSQYCVK